MIEQYVCKNYKEEKSCVTCDGFGRNKDYKVNVKECYYSKMESEKDLDFVIEQLGMGGKK